MEQSGSIRKRHKQHALALHCARSVPAFVAGCRHIQNIPQSIFFAVFGRTVRPIPWNVTHRMCSEAEELSSSSMAVMDAPKETYCVCCRLQFVELKCSANPSVWCGSRMSALNSCHMSHSRKRDDQACWTVEGSHKWTKRRDIHASLLEGIFPLNTGIS